MSNRKSDPNLNYIMQCFANAASLHSSIHCVQLNMYDEVAGLTSSVREIKIQIFEKSLDLLGKQRDKYLNDAITRYTKYKEDNKNA